MSDYRAIPLAMSYQRWRELMKNVTLKLTPEEVATGWHFCAFGYDGLLIHVLEPEFEGCSCFDNATKEKMISEARKKLP